MPSISAFAFKNTISGKVLSYLNIKDKVILNSNKENINYYIYKIKQEKPDYILGLGEYSGRDSSQLRLEQSCTNKFRNDIDGSILIRHKIESFIKFNNCSLIKQSDGIGNSWCNLISYKVINEISQNQHYSFVHIPKHFDVRIATQILMDVVSI